MYFVSIYIRSQTIFSVDMEFLQPDHSNYMHIFNFTNCFFSSFKTVKSKQSLDNLFDDEDRSLGEKE